MRITRGAVAVAVLVLVAGCSGSSDTGAGKPGSGGSSTVAAPVVVPVPADAETQPVQHGGDAADDPALWVDPDDPGESLVIGNDKKGALETYDLTGHLVQRIKAPSPFWGNVDVRQGVQVNGRMIDLVAVANDGVRLFKVDPTTRRLVPITPKGASLATGGGEGLCLYHAPTGELSVFMVFISGGVRQFDLQDHADGTVTIELVRRFRVGSESEGCVVDDEHRSLYLSEENVGLWRYRADPSGGESRTMVDRVRPRGHQIADIEGVTLVDEGHGGGFLVTSSQGQSNQQSYFSVFDRESGAYRASFRIVDGSGADGCSHTDGVTATAQPLGPRFPHGVFVCQDDKNTAPGTSGNQDFKLTRLERLPTTTP